MLFSNVNKVKPDPWLASTSSDETLNHCDGLTSIQNAGWQPSHPTNTDSSVSAERMSPGREPERGWLVTKGPVLKDRWTGPGTDCFLGPIEPGADRRALIYCQKP